MRIGESEAHTLHAAAYYVVDSIAWLSAFLLLSSTLNRAVLGWWGKSPQIYFEASTFSLYHTFVYYAMSGTILTDV